MVKLCLIYTPYIPYNNRERFKAKITEFAPKDVPYELDEIDADSERGKSFGGGKPNLVAFVSGTDYYVILQPQSGSGWLFPSDEDLKFFFKTMSDGYTRIKKGDSIDDVVSDQKEERDKEMVKEKSLGQTIGDSIKFVGIGLLVLSAGGIWLWYDSRKTTVNVNLQ
ncbi:MAG: hypothetical protein RLZZ628_4071 [Bacteroidota bacterium]